MYAFAITEATQDLVTDLNGGQSVSILVPPAFLVVEPQGDHTNKTSVMDRDDFLKIASDNDLVPTDIAIWKF